MNGRATPTTQPPIGEQGSRISQAGASIRKLQGGLWPPADAVKAAPVVLESILSGALASHWELTLDESLAGDQKKTNRCICRERVAGFAIRVGVDHGRSLSLLARIATRKWSSELDQVLLAVHLSTFDRHCQSDGEAKIIVACEQGWPRLFSKLRRCPNFGGPPSHLRL